MQTLKVKIQVKEVKMEDFSSKREAMVSIVVEQESAKNQVLVLPMFKTQEHLTHMMSNAN